MAFVKTTEDLKIGDKVKTTQRHESLSGYFEVGTDVTIIDISGRGYDIQDDEGNRIIEVGWII